MNKQDYSKLCDVNAFLSVALATIYHSDGFTNPEETRVNEILKASRIVGNMLVKKDKEK